MERGEAPKLPRRNLIALDNEVSEEPRGCRRTSMENKESWGRVGARETRKPSIRVGKISAAIGSRGKIAHRKRLITVSWNLAFTDRRVTYLRLDFVSLCFIGYTRALGTSPSEMKVFDVVFGKMNWLWLNGESWEKGFWSAGKDWYVEKIRNEGPLEKKTEVEVYSILYYPVCKLVLAVCEILCFSPYMEWVFLWI